MFTRVLKYILTVGLFVGAFSGEAFVLLETPKSSFENHISHFQNDNYHPELAQLSFGFTGVDSASVIDVAEQLYYVLSELNLEKNESLSDLPSYYDSSLAAHQAYVTPRLPELYLVKKGNKWLYPVEVHATIREAYGKHFPFGGLRNPHDAIEHHLKYLQDDNWHPDVAAQALYSENYSNEELEEKAIKLKQILDGTGNFIQLELIPEDRSFRDDESEKYLFQLSETLPEVLIKKYQGSWVYSEKTVESIDQLHKQTFPFGTHQLVTFLARKGHTRYLGLYSWQYLGVLILLVFSFIAHKIFTFFFEKIISRLIVRFGRQKVAVEYIRPVAKPFSLLLLFVFLSILIPVLQFPIAIGQYVILGTRAAVPLFGMLVFYKLVDVLAIYLQKLAERTESTLDDQLVPLLRKALKTFVVLIGILFILQNLNFNITALLAGISIGGLAIALASQDMIKNFFGSLMIFVDRPFQVGDWVVASGIDGDIEEVGFRSTRIRTFHNSVTYVPNGSLADMTIDNMGKRRYRRYKTYIGVTYDTPPEKIDAFVSGLKSIVDKHPKTRKDYYNIYLNTFSSSSLDILFYIFFDVPTWPQELEARHEINLAIMTLAEELGVSFAFPSQSLYIESLPEGGK